LSEKVHFYLTTYTRLIDIFYKNRTSIKGEIIEHLQTIKDTGIVALMKVANGFKNQLNVLSEDSILPENSSAIQERFTKAVDYFLTETIKNIVQPLSKISFSSDNKAVKKDFDKQFDKLQETLSEKIFALKKMTNGFKTKTYLHVRANAVLQKTEPTKKEKLSSKRDPILALKLRELRDDIAKAESIPHFQIFTQETLYAICDALPRTEKELLRINGMGKIRVKKHGEEILETVEEYCSKNGINHLNQQKKKDKKPTKQISFELFKSGLSVKEIAKERSLTLGTIGSHLASFIPSGEVDILELIELKKYKNIIKAIENTEFKNLTELKEKVNKSFTFMELRMVLLSRDI